VEVKEGMRRKSPVLLIFLSIALLFLSADSLRSQFRARVDLVVVPVSVRDSDNRLVPGLAREDFIILEDGQRQNVANFSIDTQPLSAAIVVDDGMGGDTLRRLAPLFIAVTAGFGPDDEMAAFRYDHFVWKLTDFTRDATEIQKSFDVIASIAENRPPQVPPGQPVAAPGNWLSKFAGLWAGGNGSIGIPSGIGSIGPPPQAPGTANPPTVPAGVVRPRNAQSSRVLHNAVFEAVTALRDRPREFRKIIFLISDGQVLGANEHKLEENIALLLRNDIQLYAVAADYALFEGNLGILGSYANATGGDVFEGGSTNAMETAFSRITEQARNQYILGYVSTNDVTSAKGVFREIDVRTRFPNQKVTHRRGYTQYR
jgi:VWFA-related protein